MDGKRSTNDQHRGSENKPPTVAKKTHAEQKSGRRSSVADEARSHSSLLLANTAISHAANSGTIGGKPIVPQKINGVAFYQSMGCPPPHSH